MRPAVPSLRPRARSPRPWIVGLATALVAWAATPARAEWVDWIAEARLRAEWDDNLNRSAFGADEADDLRWEPSISLGRVFQATERTRLAASVDVEGALYHTYERLNATEYGVTLSALHKLGVGDVPWIRWHGFAGQRNLREDERDSILLETGLQVGMRFSPRLDGSIAYLYTDRGGANGGLRAAPGIGTRVFDQSAHHVTWRMSYALWPGLLGTVGYTYRNGDFHSHCTVGNVGKVFAREGSNVEAIRLDTVFGHANLPDGRRGCVYKLDGDAHSAFVNLSWALGRRASVDLGYRFLRGEGRRLIYRSNAVTLALLFRY
jgi:hypothetical protein